MRQVQRSTKPGRWVVEDDDREMLAKVVSFMVDDVLKGRETWETIERNLAPDGDGYSVREVLSVWRIKTPDDSIYTYNDEFLPPDYQANEMWGISIDFPTREMELEGEDLRHMIAQVRQILQVAEAEEAAKQAEQQVMQRSRFSLRLPRPRPR